MTPKPTNIEELREALQDFAVMYYEALEDDDYELAERLTLKILRRIATHTKSLLERLEKQAVPAESFTYKQGYGTVHSRLAVPISAIKEELEKL